MKKDLIHFIRWELVAEDQVERVLAGLPQWGVRDIVAHPKWFRDDGESYVEKIALLLKKYGLRSTACHALWGDGNDCIIPDPTVWADMIRRQSLFMEQLQVLGVTTFTIHTGMLLDLPGNDNLGLLRKTIDALLPCCEKTGITLAVENSAEPLPFIQDVENPFCQGDNFIRLLITDDPAHEHELVLAEDVVTCADSEGMIGAL